MIQLLLDNKRLAILMVELYDGSRITVHSNTITGIKLSTKNAVTIHFAIASG